MSPPAADSAHPAFSKMFVQTEFVAERGALLATRRPRDPGQAPAVDGALHFAGRARLIGGLQFETDRARFLGSGRDVRNAASIMDAQPLSNSVGTVLDPVLALRRRVRIDPGETVQAAFWTGIAASRAQALELVEKLAAKRLFSARNAVAGESRRAQLRDLGIEHRGRGNFSGYRRTDAVCRCVAARPAELLDRNQLGQSALWTHGVSGDLPIVLL